MLIGAGRSRPDLGQIRRIKAALRQALDLSEADTVTVTELACLEEGCAPIETVVGLLRPGKPQVQHKLHKPTSGIQAEDLVEVCKAWGLNGATLVFRPFTKET